MKQGEVTTPLLEKKHVLVRWTFLGNTLFLQPFPPTAFDHVLDAVEYNLSSFERFF